MLVNIPTPYVCVCGICSKGSKRMACNSWQVRKY